MPLITAEICTRETYKVHIFANIIHYVFFYRVGTSFLCLIKVEQLIFQKNRISSISCSQNHYKDTFENVFPLIFSWDLELIGWKNFIFLC